MNKKALVARTLGIGKARVHFVEARINEINEAITKQDVRDLIKDGAIIIKNIKGRRTGTKGVKKSKGNVRKVVRQRKRRYVLLTRKLRGTAREMKNEGKIDKKELTDIRKRIKNKHFKSRANLLEFVGAMKK